MHKVTSLIENGHIEQQARISLKQHKRNCGTQSAEYPMATHVWPSAVVAGGQHEKSTCGNFYHMTAPFLQIDTDVKADQIDQYI